MEVVLFNRKSRTKWVSPPIWLHYCATAGQKIQIYAHRSAECASTQMLHWKRSSESFLFFTRITSKTMSPCWKGFYIWCRTFVREGQSFMTGWSDVQAIILWAAEWVRFDECLGKEAWLIKWCVWWNNMLTTSRNWSLNELECWRKQIYEPTNYSRNCYPSRNPSINAVSVYLCFFLNAWFASELDARRTICWSHH